MRNCSDQISPGRTKSTLGSSEATSPSAQTHKGAGKGGAGPREADCGPLTGGDRGRCSLSPRPGSLGQVSRRPEPRLPTGDTNLRLLDALKERVCTRAWYLTAAQSVAARAAASTLPLST